MKVNEIIPLTEKMYVSDTWSKYKKNPFDSDLSHFARHAKVGAKKLFRQAKNQFKAKDKRRYVHAAASA